MQHKAPCVENSKLLIPGPFLQARIRLKHTIPIEGRRAAVFVVCIAMAPLIIRQASSESDENKNRALFSVCGVFLVLSSAGLAARMISKRIKRTQFLIDDVLIVWAYVG